MKTPDKIYIPPFAIVNKWRKRSSLGGHCLNESFTLKEDLYPRKYNPLRRCIRNKETIEHIFQKYYSQGKNTWFTEMNRWSMYYWLKDLGNQSDSERINHE